MKKYINPFKFLAIIALFALPALSRANHLGDGDDVEKKKTISKTYQVTSKDKLEINNQFGEVQIHTWDKNEIKVDIEMGVEAGSEEKAKRLLDEIEVHENRSGSTISFKTDVGEMKNNHHGKNNKGDNRNFHIDYTVYMPAANPLDLENSFGKTSVGDMKGEVNLTSKFGSLTAGNLDNVDEIDVEFGEAQIGNVHNGKITFKFNGKSLIGRVSGSVKIVSEFSGNVQFNVDDNISELNITESYSSVRMVASKALSASFTVHTSFGSFKNRTDFNIKEEKEDEDDGPKFDKDYKGSANSGSGKIKIKSSFGSVSLSHTAEVFKEKASDKNKNKNKNKHEDDDDDDDDDHDSKSTSSI
jgi:hypothetical protein